MTESINFLRFMCDAGHVTTVKHPDIDGKSVSLDWCSVCGSQDTRKVASQSIDADILQTNMDAISYEEPSF